LLMPEETKSVEVIAANRAVEALTGNSIFQVVFGVMSPISDELRPQLPRMEGTVPPKEIGINTMVLFFPFPRGLPYVVGSKWTLRIADDGRMTLSPA
jgi:hypothetical protein